MTARALFAPLLLAAAALMASCHADSPSPGPEARCADACRARAAGCSDEQCARGCRFVLDRLIEHEGERVLACVAKAAKKACDDVTFADCAVLTGPHADGGPPAPKPPSDDDLP